MVAEPWLLSLLFLVGSIKDGSRRSCIFSRVEQSEHGDDEAAARGIAVEKLEWWWTSGGGVVGELCGSGGGVVEEWFGSVGGVVEA